MIPHVVLNALLVECSLETVFLLFGQFLQNIREVSVKLWLLVRVSRLNASYLLTLSLIAHIETVHIKFQVVKVH